jgi:transposase-like protein
MSPSKKNEGRHVFLKRSERRPAGERERLVKEMLSSSKTQKEWCLERGVKYSTFRDWLNKFKHKGQDDGAVWVEVLKKERSETTSSGVEVRIGSYAVKIAPGFDSDVFMDVCRSLSELC